MPSDALIEVIDTVPKVELHVHLEGTFSPARIAELAEAAGQVLPRPADQMYVTTDLADFLDALDLVCGLVRDPATAAAQAGSFAHTLGAQGVRYAEVIVNPTHWSGLEADQLVVAVCDGFEAAHRDGGADCRLLPSLLRSQSEDEALALVELMVRLDLARIVGLSIDGDEAAVGPGSSARFAAAYDRARSRGFGTTAHAGESSGPEGVSDALDLLGVSRVDHGVRAIEDADLVARLVADQVTLNVCVSSNCHLLRTALAEHPIGALIDAGVPVTVNTDDPETLGISLTSELHLVSEHLGWGPADLVEAQRRAVWASFASAEVKQGLLAALDDFQRALG